MRFTPDENCFRRRKIAGFIDIEKRIKRFAWPIDDGGAVVL